MRDEKMIEMLESIPKVEAYSKYSHSLEKMFKKNCLKDLLHDLKYPKHFQQAEFDEKHKAKFAQRKHFNDNIADIDSFAIPSEPKVKAEQATEIVKCPSPGLKVLNVRKMNKINALRDIPDPGKYNPNYDAISKNIPSILIRKPDTDLSRIRRRDDILLEKIAHIKNKRRYDERKETSKTDRRLGRNHALDFGQYTSRKEEKIPDFHLPKLTYLEPFDYLTNIKNVPDFSKMRQREENDLLNQYSLEVPSICHYQPKYTMIEKQSPSISFSNEKPKMDKQFLIKRIWKSYDVEPGYKLVNLPLISEPSLFKPMPTID